MAEPTTECQNCGRTINADQAWYVREDPGDLESSGLVAFCDQECANRKHDRDIDDELLEKSQNFCEICGESVGTPGARRCPDCEGYEPTDADRREYGCVL